MTADVRINGRTIAVIAAALLMAATSFMLGRSTSAGADVGPGFDISSPQAAAASFEANLAAATSMYMKIGDIKGEALERDHKDWINLLSVSHGLHQPGGGATGATRRRGDVIMDDITCTKELDKSSPELAESVATGKVHPEAIIDLVGPVGPDGGSDVYLKIVLKNVMVTSYQMSGAAGGFPEDACSLRFGEIVFTYTEYDAQGAKKGNVDYSWKVEEGTT